MNLVESVLSGDKVSLRKLQIFLTDPGISEDFRKVIVKKPDGNFKYLKMEISNGSYVIWGVNKEGNKDMYVVLFQL